MDNPCEDARYTLKDMTMYSTNYPIPHEVGEGVYEITENDCHEDSGVVMRGRTIEGVGSYEVDIAETAKYRIGLDDVSIPNLESGLKQLSPLSFTASGIAFGNGMFVVVGQTGYIATSTDGVSWTTQKIGEYNWQSVVYGDAGFVAAGNGGRIATSMDGVVWETQTLAGSYNYLGIAFGNGVYVVIGALGWLARSLDGITWTQGRASTRTYYGITHGDGKFVAVGVNGSIVTSTDGISWTEIQIAAPNLLGVTYGNGLYVAVGINGYIADSTDLFSWRVNRIGTGTWRSISFGNGVFVAGGDGLVATSSEAVDWTTQTVDVSSLPISWRASVYGNGVYILVGYSGSYAVSQDASEWDVYSFLTTWRDVAYGAGKYIAAGNSGYVAVSVNGTTWSIQQAGGSSLMSITYANGRFVAVGIGGYIVTSTDGLSWQTQQVGTGTWYDITFANGIFMVVGTSSLILTSADGLTWDSNIVEGGTWTTVTYGNGIFVIAGLNGVIARSTNGVNWTKTQSGSLSWNGAVFGNGVFVLVGEEGNIATSPNGSRWTSQKVGTTAWNDVTFNESQEIFYVVGTGGGILQSSDFKDVSIIESPETLYGVYSQGNVLIVVGSYYIFARVTLYGTFIQDAGLVKDFSIDNSPATYTVAYDYNTEYISDIGSFRLNSDPINNEFVIGQYLTLSAYDELCDNAKTITVSLNSSPIVTDTTSNRSVQYWFDTIYSEASPGDIITISISDANGNEYSVDYKCTNACVRYVLYYVNKYGALDTLILKGDVVEQFGNDQYLINKNYNRLLDYDFQRKVISNTIEKVYHCNTGGLLTDQASKIDHLLSSPKVWIHDLELATIRAAVIDTNNYQIRTTRTDNDLPSYSFNLLQSQDIIRRG